MSRIISAVTCYNNDTEVVEFGKQLAAQSCADSIVYLITINSAKDYDKLQQELKALQVENYLYKAPKNLGYLNGCLYGIKQYRIIREDDIIIVSNTDLQINNKNAFIRIEEKMKEKNVWCLGPCIQLKTGEYQNPFLSERPAKQKVLIWKLMQGNHILLMLYNSLSKIKKQIKSSSVKLKTTDVYAVHGSCFIMNKVGIQKLMDAANNVFMYGEELLVAEIVRLNNGIIRYADDIDIIHSENSTTRLANARVKAKWYKQSFNYIYLNFFGRD